MKKDNKKEVLRRLRIIEGHLKKVIEMVEKDKYCIDILNQSLAVQNALKEVDALLLNKHLHRCVAEAFKKGKKPKEKSIKELLKIFKNKQRR